MAISFQCSHCQRSYTTSEQLAGKTVKCKQCGQPVKVPSASAPAPSDVDVYGLSEIDHGERQEPAATNVLPPRGFAPVDAGAPKPKAKKPASKKPKEKSSSSAGLFGGVGGTIAVLALLALRIYFRYDRNQARQARQNNQAAATAFPQALPTFPANGGAAQNVGPWTMPKFPQPPPPTQIEPGVMFSEVPIQRAQGAGPPQPGHGGKLWLYLPSGQHAAKSLPCILIAGAGSNLITGMDLGDGDRAEHLPHVRAGFAVLAYELDGALPENSNQNMQALARSSTAFLKAQAGLINARVAIEYATTQVPSIDPKRLYTVGHSSAATVALLVAENEPRIAGCVAFAPAVDVKKNFPPEAQQAIAQLVPGADQFFTRFNPSVNESKIGCPLFLFYADDDARFASQVRELGARLQAAGKQVTVSSVASGGHYDSMINEGVPRAIEWLKALPEPSRSDAPP
jgi:dienelactone hydrolase